ncbi:hypothetical protein [Tuberibacillus sp. Marseille-P3662]|uniref:hypothetical protein n=1 Tax=Tuberibacillus sp. Marseille-P3662 TaxID=1965358 RepID=UPI000A1C8B18|nr:hypothetical protein [Tuberibacillus sp. Marseille-P3662]
MLTRVFFLFVGFGLAVSGGVTIIAFLNLLTIGQNYLGYLQFLTDRPETYLLLAGIAIMWLSIYFPKFK